MRKFSAIEKTVGWPLIYKQANDLLGQKKTEKIFLEAIRLSEKYQKDHKDRKGINKMHIQAAIAIGALYLPLKEEFGSETAVQMLEDAEKPLSVMKHDKIEKLPASLFMKVAYVITSAVFGEKAGFKRKWHCNTAKERRFDLLTCPYVETLREMGCPEVCGAICVQDDISFSDMKNGVLFERTKTLGRGGDCCDFCFRISND